MDHLDHFLRSLEPALSDPNHPDHQQALAAEAVYLDDHKPTVYPPDDGWSGQHGDMRRRFATHQRAEARARGDEPALMPGVTPDNRPQWRWLWLLPLGFALGLVLSRCGA